MARDQAADSVIDLRASGGNTISIGNVIVQGWSRSQVGGTSPLIGVKNGATGSFVTVDKLQVFTPPNTLYTNATSDYVTLKYPATQATGNDFNTQTLETFAHGIRDLAHGNMLREADGFISDTSGGNFLLNAAAASTVVLGPKGLCGVWVHPTGLLPGMADGTTAGCSNNIGTASFPPSLRYTPTALSPTP